MMHLLYYSNLGNSKIKSCNQLCCIGRQIPFTHVAKPVLNIAIGYRIKIAENIVFLCGFKTDINSRKGVDYKSYSDYNKLQALHLNVYHVTGGLRLNLGGHELIYCLIPIF